MKTSIVILNWNGKKWMEKFLPSVIRYSQSEDVEIVVADNASTDDSIIFLTEKYPNVRLLIFEKNWGFAEGYNKALNEIKSKYTVLLNSDVEVTDNWLATLTTFMDANPDVAAVQPKILAELNKDRFEYAGAAGGFIDQYGYPFCRGRIFSEVEQDKGQYNDAVDIFWATGACLMIRTDVYKSTGGLDGSFFAHQEEIDLCWRLKARGHRIVCLPSSTVYHVGGGTLAQESPRKTFLNFRNNLLMLYKNLPERKLKRVLRIRTLLDLIGFVQFLLCGKKENAKAILEARREFKKILPEYKSKRRENIQKTTSEDIPEMYKGLLVISFYLKRRKLFKHVIWK
ncbi:MAG: glycosyltransferase, group 2 family protein [Bacteroidetes bacterium]|nr:glycosyltransferase, group 2 family protein [Bacteroidota bacterium]